MSSGDPQNLSIMNRTVFEYQGNPPICKQPMNQPQSTHKRRYNLFQNASNITTYLVTVWLPSQTPTPEELLAKERVKEELNQSIQQVFPGSSLVLFGSMANNFALKNSDMDLCCLFDGPMLETRSQMVEIFGAFLSKESAFRVRTLSYARIPIIHLNLPKSPDLPNGLACDIGFENRVALESTRMLAVYSALDPRVVPIVLFFKAFVKKRRINSPYHGTLSSYGYVLMTLFYLVHVAKPPVLPNLQRFRPRAKRTLEGCDISFFDDVDKLRKKWILKNTQSIGELVVDFFHYFASVYAFQTHVISLRSPRGILMRSDKGWWLDSEKGCYNRDRRALNKLCIEDPFQTNSNVARTVTSEGLFLMRGEIKRALSLLTSPDANIHEIMESLFEERKDSFLPNLQRSFYPGLGSQSTSPGHSPETPRRASEPPSHMGPGRETQVPLIYETAQIPPFWYFNMPYPLMGPRFGATPNMSETSQSFSPPGTIHVLPPAGPINPPFWFWMPHPSGIAYPGYYMLPNGLAVAAGGSFEPLASLGMSDHRDVRLNAMNNGYFNPIQEVPGHLLNQGLAMNAFALHRAATSTVQEMATPVQLTPPIAQFAQPVLSVASDSRSDVPQESEESVTSSLNDTRVLSRRHSWDGMQKLHEDHDSDYAPDAPKTLRRIASDSSLWSRVVSQQELESSQKTESGQLVFEPETNEPLEVVYERRILRHVSPIEGRPGFYLLHGRKLPSYDFLVSKEYGILLGEHD